MPKPEPQQKTPGQLFAERFDSAVTADDVAKAFRALLTAIDRKRTADRKDSATAIRDLVKQMRAIEKALANAIDEKTAAATKDQGTAIDDLFALLSDIEAKLDTFLEQYPSNRDADAAAIVSRFPAIPSIDDLANDLPKLVTRVRDGFELLQGDERLDISAIKGVDELEQRLSPARSGGGVYVSQRGAVRAYDLSDKLDGVTKTFALPAFLFVLNVQSTSSPVTFRPRVDYTIDGVGMTITFTDQIDAASTLASGQSLITLYVEP